MSEELASNASASTEVEFVDPTPHDDINSACNALWALDGVDEKLVSGRTRKIRAIRRYAIDIIYEQVKYIHSTLFDKDEDEDDEE